MAEEAGEYGEGPGLILPAEDQPFALSPDTLQFLVPYDVPVVERKLTFEEASKCLNTLGKDESGVRYAYLQITATEKMLTDISIVTSFKHVMFLDVSGNFLNLEALQVLADMPYLIMLKANRNRIDSGALVNMPYLQVLCLNVNKIEETNEFCQPMLETLELEFNSIFTVQFSSEKLPNLKELDLKGNHLCDLSGSYPKSIEKLFITQNKITKLNNFTLTQLTNLTTLHLRNNRIRKLDGFSEFLTKLTYLNLRNNNITKLRQFRKLMCLPKLETLVYSENPVEGKRRKVEEMPGEGGGENEDEDEELYGEDGEPAAKSAFDPVRIGVLCLLPNLKRINKDFVTPLEREEAIFNKDKRVEKIMTEESSEEETEPATTTYTSEAADESATEADTLNQSNLFEDEEN